MVGLGETTLAEYCSTGAGASVLIMDAIDLSVDWPCLLILSFLRSALFFLTLATYFARLSSSTTITSACPLAGLDGCRGMAACWSIDVTSFAFSEPIYGWSFRAAPVLSGVPRALDGFSLMPTFRPVG